MSRGTVKKVLRRWIIFAVLVLAAAGIAAWKLWPDPLRVETAKVERGTVEATVANTRAGTVKAGRRARLAPPTGGRLARLPVSEGDRVEAGALLLELWNDDLQAQLELADSEQRSAEASAKQACLRARQAARDAERLRRLHSDGVASDEEVDRANTEAEALAAACEAAEAAANVSKSRVAVARAMLDRTRVVAPFAGIVAQLDAELGEYVTPSPPGIPMPAAIDLIDESRLYVRAPIDEVDAPFVKVGMIARITLDAFQGEPLEGRVRRVAAFVLDREKQARTVDVDVDLLEDPTSFSLLPGYTADVEVILERSESTLRVPTECVIDGERVFTLADGALAEKAVRVGLSNWRHTEILEGLAEGDLVVTSLEREGVEDGAKAVAEGSSKELSENN